MLLPVLPLQARRATLVLPLCHLCQPPLVGVPRDVLTLLVKNVENLEREKVELAGRNNEMWDLLRGAYRKLQRQVVDIAQLQTDLTREMAEKAALQTSENRFRRALAALLAPDEDIETEG